MKKLLKNKRKINIAFIKRGGLGAGGSERWLQFAAITFVKNNYNVDYYYSEDRQDINRIKDLKKNADVVIKLDAKHRLSAIRFN